ADGALSGRNGDTVPAAELDRVIGPVDDGAAALLQPGENTIEGHRPRAEDVRQANARFASPSVGPDDQTERLVARALLGNRKCKLQLRLRSGVSDRIGTMCRSSPACDPAVRASGRRQ